jgi:hypothetical protein
VVGGHLDTRRDSGNVPHPTIPSLGLKVLRRLESLLHSVLGQDFLIRNMLENKA